MMQLRSWTFAALGTNWSIETFRPLDNTMKHAITERIELFDKTYSRFRSDSLVSKLAQPGTYKFPSDISPLMRIYTQLYGHTMRKMTPMIGSLLEDAGYDAKYSLQPRKLRRVNDLSELGWDGEQTLHTTQPIVLDVGAAGKGYLVDLIAGILEKGEYSTYVIDASGDILTKGIVQRIGLEHPYKEDKVIGAVEVNDESLCASATNRRQWGTYHHIFDPHNKKPVEDIVATWVVAQHGLVADALATALFFSPADTLLEEYNFSYVIMKQDGTIDYSPRFEGQLFI